MFKFIKKLFSNDVKINAHQHTEQTSPVTELHGIFELDDENEVLSYLGKDTDILRYANERLRDNYEFALKVIAVDEASYGYVSDRLKGSVNFALDCIKVNKSSFVYFSDELKNNSFVSDVFNSDLCV